MQRCAIPIPPNPLLERFGDMVVPVHLDLTMPESIAALADTAPDVQVVANNAAVFKTATPLDADAIDALEMAMKINVYGLIRMAQTFAPILAKNGGGAFIQLNSVASLKCASNFATHSASKAAAYSITQALRELLARQGTTVLSVHPGLIATDMETLPDLAGTAAPPSVVAEGIIAALRSGGFHLFPTLWLSASEMPTGVFLKMSLKRTLRNTERKIVRLRLRNNAICPINSFGRKQSRDRIRVRHKSDIPLSGSKHHRRMQ